MRVKDMNEHFLSRAPWVNRERTNDLVMVGDPEKDVKTMLVSWTPSFKAVRAAVDGGFDMLLTHEPLLDVDSDRDETPKKTFALDHNLPVLRNHDAWDIWPEIGMPWAWAQALGFSGKPVAISKDKTQHRYDIEPVRFDDLARRIAAHTAALHEPVIEVTGDPDQIVSRFGTGTGCACNINTFIEMGCDSFICSEDGSAYWAGIQFATDRGYPVMVANHGTSEEPGMVTMTKYVNDNFEGVAATHLPQGAPFKRVGV